jgi:hypothetical protein
MTLLIVMKLPTSDEWAGRRAVPLGLLAFFGSGLRSTRVAVLASIAFVAFADVNCSGMPSPANASPSSTSS